MPDWPSISDVLQTDTGIRLDAGSARPVGGGCINAAWRLDSSTGAVFVKTNEPGALAMFEAESDGLRELGRSGGVRVPEPLASGMTGDSAWLAMEWIEPGASRSDSERLLGEGLAVQHRATRSTFGWDRDNTIGSTPQENAPCDDWAQFFALHRLTFQLDLVEASGWGGRLAAGGRRLVEAVPLLLSGHQPAPALLHGDLWGGNWACDADGQPFVFDPAVYYGDREADLAMTRLFGGFGRDFYAAYESSWPVVPGAGLRMELYNLYHVLNHVNLFGAGYAGRAETIIRRLLAEVQA